jgi:hypothetical protein
MENGGGHIPAEQETRIKKTDPAEKTNGDNMACHNRVFCL